MIDRITCEMPPKKETKRPTAGDSANVVEWIGEPREEGEAARTATQTKVTHNGLRLDQYINTARDLIGGQYAAKDPGDFLEHPEWHGFERLGSVLTLSPWPGISGPLKHPEVAHDYQ